MMNDKRLINNLLNSLLDVTQGYIISMRKHYKKEEYKTKTIISIFSRSYLSSQVIMMDMYHEILPFISNISKCTALENISDSSISCIYERLVLLEKYTNFEYINGLQGYQKKCGKQIYKIYYCNYLPNKPIIQKAIYTLEEVIKYKEKIKSKKTKLFDFF